MTPSTHSEWPQLMFDRLQAGGVTWFSYVPDAGNKCLIELAQAHKDTRPVLLSTEEEGVALCAGVDLAGGRAILCMQSSGLGNCVNFLSLVKNGAFPILMMISMRGEQGEQNPWQVPMGQAADAVLKVMDVEVIDITSLDEVVTATDKALDKCFGEGRSAAIVVRQSFLGVKQF